MKGEPSPTGRGQRRSRDEKGNQGVEDFRFTNILQLFSIYFFFSITVTLSLFFYKFFTHDIYPQPHPRPTTSTHDPRHLATLRFPPYDAADPASPISVEGSETSSKKCHILIRISYRLLLHLFSTEGDKTP